MTKQELEKARQDVLYDERWHKKFCVAVVLLMVAIIVVEWLGISKAMSIANGVAFGGCVALEVVSLREIKVLDLALEQLDKEIKESEVECK